MHPTHLSTAANDVWMRFVAAELEGDQVDFEQLCGAHGTIAAELRELRTYWLTPQAPPLAPGRALEVEPIESLLQRLAQPSTRLSRYRFDGELARGGMGVVHRVWDLDLGRPLALKRLRSQHGAMGRRALQRFVAEAQIVAQLDHPAIVPVHDIGVDELGCPFFVMKLVEGCELRETFELAWLGARGWGTTRALGALLKVAEAVGYAHERGFMHRDLKPSNVMVGQFGEVYVMDWGVARVLAAFEHGASDGGERRSTAARPNSVGAGSDAGAEFLTADGEVIGTAAYMSPEQAHGDSAHVTARSDVYAFGAMLYHLLAQRVPYASEGLTSAELLVRLRAGPPPPLAQLAPRAAHELVAVCEKAMARSPDERYANLSECADDLRAFLEGRVVRAYRTGAWTEAAKWIQRNRALSASFVVAVTLGASALWTVQRAARARSNLELLSRLRQPTELLIEYELLWPPSERTLPEMERWLVEAERVAGRIEEYREQLANLRARAEPWDPTAAHERRAERQLEERRERGRRLIEFLEQQRLLLWATGASETFDGMSLVEIELQLARDRPIVERRFAQTVERETWTFAEPTDELLHDRLAALIPDVERLAFAATGDSPIERVRHALEFERRRDPALELARRAAWDDALASICDVRACPQYGGLELVAQEGLAPLGRDPASGLWEFAHLLSGEPAQRGADGRLVIEEQTGIVLVLLPGAEYHQGTQDTAPDEPHFDPWRQLDEGPITAVVLDPFFLSKYELTQAQWRRWTGFDPSFQSVDSTPGVWFAATQPVEGVAWQVGVDTLRELGLQLPTEAQWEYAARANSTTPWSDPRGIAGLAYCANLRDRTYERFALALGQHPERFEALDPEVGDDGFDGSAPVGTFEPNGFGLHDMHGNVWEWTADVGPLDLGTPRWLGSGARATQGIDDGGRVVRGGSYSSSPRAARCGARAYLGPESAMADLGLRPARAVER